MARISKQEYETRRDACAIIYAADRPETMADIMETRGVETELEAARLYTNGILLRMVRTGAVKNRVEGLERIEDAQVAGHGRMPTVNKLARTVARLNRKTGRGYMRILPDGTREHVAPVKAEKRAHVATIGIGRFYGSIYVELNAAESVNTVENALNDAEIDAARARAADIAREYIREYMDGMTRKARETIEDVKAIDRDIMDTRDALRDKVLYLYRDFPAREQVSAREYVRLLRAYA